MTPERAHAYARVMKTLRDVGPAKLLPPEQARVRSAADALLFCDSVATNRSARTAYADIQALRGHLVATGRWTHRRADELEEDLWACGPGLGVALAAAA